MYSIRQIPPSFSSRIEILKHFCILHHNPSGYYCYFFPCQSGKEKGELTSTKGCTDARVSFWFIYDDDALVVVRGYINMDRLPPIPIIFFYLSCNANSLRLTNTHPSLAPLYTHSLITIIDTIVITWKKTTLDPDQGKQLRRQ